MTHRAGPSIAQTPSAGCRIALPRIAPPRIGRRGPERPGTDRRRALPATAVGLLLALGVACGSEPIRGGVEVSVRGVGVDARTASPVVVLRERAGDRELPIWIGEAEARSIAIQLEEIEIPRPNTHDLARRLLTRLDARVKRAVVTRLHAHTYFAVLVLERNGKRLEVDARPSDAIAIALRSKAPLFVAESLLEAADGGSEEAPDADDDQDELTL